MNIIFFIAEMTESNRSLIDVNLGLEEGEVQGRRGASKSKSPSAGGTTTRTEEKTLAEDESVCCGGPPPSTRGIDLPASQQDSERRRDETIM